MREALDERGHRIEQRAVTLVDAALRNREPWIRALGTPPTDLHHAAQWRNQAQIVAAYRDRYTITGTRPLGDSTGSDTQRDDARHAAAALAVAQQLAAAATSKWTPAPELCHDFPGLNR